jgi:2-hydroxycyclohexanecarboxyl-CoA dehydrogenase
MAANDATGADLDAKVAIVTGGAGGIGGGVSRRLAAAGAIVVVVDIDKTTTDETVADISAAGGEALGVVGDIRDPDVVALAARTAIDRGGVDVLVNNVGDYRLDPSDDRFLPAGRFAHSTDEQWREIYAINLEHVFRMTRAVLPTMLANHSGSIVNVSTVEAFRGIPNNVVYSVFKAGVVEFTRSLAVEVGKDGVRVNAIAPDLADSLQTPAAVMLQGRDASLVPQWVPLARFGTAADYADVVLFLAGDQSRYVTGHTIPVDGGTLASSGWYRRADGRGWTNLPTAP